MDRLSSTILKRLIEQWNEVRAGLERIHPVAEVRPFDSHVFRAVDGPKGAQPDQAAYFELLPVVFNLPEYARHNDNDLFVVVRGLLSFRRKEFTESSLLLTHSFATEVGYFRRDGSELQHVYGAHYDFALNHLGHPVFHAQMKSFVGLGSHIREQYHSDLTDAGDSVKGVLTRVRVPTAQMDVFSLVIQLCADHLLFSGSGLEELEAFQGLVDKNRFCQGAAFQVAKLHSDEAIRCYRGVHWYP